MNKKNLSLLMVLVALIVVLPAGIAVAKAATQNITFNLADGSWQESEVDTSYFVAAVNLTGKLMERGGAQYLTPLHGVLTVEDAEYKIQVKALKQSEPLYVQEMTITLPPSMGGYILMTQTYSVVEANVEGGKFMGWLQWATTTRYDADGNIVGETSGSASLTLNGVVDGKLVSRYVSGEAPEIE